MFVWVAAAENTASLRKSRKDKEIRNLEPFGIQKPCPFTQKSHINDLEGFLVRLMMTNDRYN